MITLLITAQNQNDSQAFVAIFSQNAVVYDEGHTHRGTQEIESWNVATNKKYATQLELVQTTGDDTNLIATMRVSGNFEGSPIKLNYHLKIYADKITELRITD
jgi:hypothetical protein